MGAFKRKHPDSSGSSEDTGRSESPSDRGYGHSWSPLDPKSKRRRIGPKQQGEHGRQGDSGSVGQGSGRRSPGEGPLDLTRQFTEANEANEAIIANNDKMAKIRSKEWNGVQEVQNAIEKRNGQNLWEHLERLTIESSQDAAKAAELGVAAGAAERQAAAEQLPKQHGSYGDGQQSSGSSDDQGSPSRFLGSHQKDAVEPDAARVAKQDKVAEGEKPVGAAADYYGADHPAVLKEQERLWGGQQSPGSFGDRQSLDDHPSDGVGPDQGAKDTKTGKQRATGEEWAKRMIDRGLHRASKYVNDQYKNRQEKLKQERLERLVRKIDFMSERYDWHYKHIGNLNKERYRTNDEQEHNEIIMKQSRHVMRIRSLAGELRGHAEEIQNDAEQDPLVRELAEKIVNMYERQEKHWKEFSEEGKKWLAADNSQEKDAIFKGAAWRMEQIQFLYGQQQKIAQIMLRTKEEQKHILEYLKQERLERRVRKIDFMSERYNWHYGRIGNLNKERYRTNDEQEHDEIIMKQSRHVMRIRSLAGELRGHAEEIQNDAEQDPLVRELAEKIVSMHERQEKHWKKLSEEGKKWWAANNSQGKDAIVRGVAWRIERIQFLSELQQKLAQVMLRPKELQERALAMVQGKDIYIDEL